MTVTDFDTDVFLHTAAQLCPTLYTKTVSPVGLVRIVPDKAEYQGWCACKTDGAWAGPWQAGECFIVDFGSHWVGTLLLSSQDQGEWHIEPAEMPCELGDSWEEFPASFGNGTVPKRQWMPLCGEDRGKRMAMRYVRVTILDAPAAGVTFDQCAFEATSGVDFLAGVASYSDTLWQSMHDISVRTLRNCIQDVFEDGPKRDRRLWLGDLRLEARLSYQCMNANDIIKRCLYLHAGTLREDGMIPACVYNPIDGPKHGNEMIPDYAMLYGPTLYDYVQASGDVATGEELYDLACQQVVLLCERYAVKGRLTLPEEMWCFIDWCGPLHRDCAEQATAIYALRELLALGEFIGREDRLETLQDWHGQLSQGAHTHFWCDTEQCFVSGGERQVSWASQVWMVLAGVVSGDGAKSLLTRMLTDERMVKPGCPYLMHHAVEALCEVGLINEARTILKDYWGDMVKKGADTFWEVYNANDDRLSPYRSHLFNSYCHAWSCTPAWFLAKYPELTQ